MECFNYYTESNPVVSVTVINLSTETVSAQTFSHTNTSDEDTQPSHEHKAELDRVETTTPTCAVRLLWTEWA